MRDPFKLFQREFDRRFKRHEGKYDYADFAFELFKEKEKIKKAATNVVRAYDAIEYAL